MSPENLSKLVTSSDLSAHYDGFPLMMYDYTNYKDATHKSKGRPKGSHYRWIRIREKYTKAGWTSIMAGTGSVLSMFPPENAKGSFVKVVQRIPVNIVLSDMTTRRHPLRAGMSVVPTIIIE